MKKITITKPEGCTEVWEKPTKEGRPDSIECYGQEEMDASDGYHTFTELYDHRITLWIALCKQHQGWIYQPGERNMRSDGYDHKVWRSKNHSDGQLAYDGKWFVLGINRTAGTQITYHLPIERWEETNFADTLEKAPKFDGHTSEDVLSRLKTL